jgi:hypothetical protein
MKKQQWILAILATVAGVMITNTGNAQSTDALLDKLVEKGVLTVKDANELRAESDKNFNTALSAKMGMPDWVTALKLNGDVRGRYENFSSDNSAFVERTRFRYRLRFGVTAQLMDDFEVGFRLTSDETAAGGANNEGDPISGNTTFQNNGSKKLVYLDQVYGKWTPFKGPHLMGSFTVGKMENPFVLSDMVFDPDYTPEGVASQMAYRFNDVHTARLNAGAFMLDELANNSADPFLVGGQARWDANWSPKIQTSLGLAGLIIANGGSLTNSAVPNVNRGNSRNLDGTLTYGFHSIVADASIVYVLDSAPFYAGPFPIKLAGDYMFNPEAPGSANNYAYSVGVTFGKAGKRKTWELAYTYKYLGANAWWEELVDSDFGAFYPANNSPANSGANIGYGAGTNVRGHIVRFAYSPSDSFTLSVKWFMTELINTFPATFPASSSKSDMSRLQVDASWKF